MTSIPTPDDSCEPAAMTEKTVVLYPSLGVGHLNPMVQLAKAFLRRGVAVTIAVVDPPGKDPVLEAAVARLAAACPSMAVRLLPIPPACADKQYSHPAMRMLDELRLAGPVLREFLGSLPVVDALMLDMFCIDALDLAAELAVPAYIFYPSVAGDLEWLDRQPKQSVVFLCFGSRGVFSAAQLGEMARGLEESGHRFLWTVCTPREGPPAVLLMNFWRSAVASFSSIAGRQLQEAEALPPQLDPLAVMVPSSRAYAVGGGATLHSLLASGLEMVVAGLSPRRFQR